MFLVAFWKSTYQGRSGVWWEPGTRKRDQSKQHLNFLIISYTPSFTDHIINIVKEIYDTPTFRVSEHQPPLLEGKQHPRLSETTVQKCNPTLGKTKINICCSTSRSPVRSPLFQEDTRFWNAALTNRTLLNCSRGRCHKQAATWQTYRFPGLISQQPVLSYQATLICNLLQGEESGARDTWNIYWRILEASHKGGDVQAKRKNSGLETTNEQEQTVRWKGQTHLSLPSQQLTLAGILNCFDTMKSPPQHRHYLNTRV